MQFILDCGAIPCIARRGLNVCYRILVVDDFVEWRQKARSILERNPEIQNCASLLKHLTANKLFGRLANRNQI